MTKHLRVAIVAAVIIAAVLLPFVVSTAWQGILTKMLIAALFAMGFNLLLGQAGLLSFGHAAFYGLGAMATLHAMIAIERGVFYIPILLLPLVGAAAGLIVAFVAGCFATRRSGAYFALVTLAMAELIHVIAPMWETVFGGEAGLTSMRMPSLGLTFGSAREVYFLTLAWTALAIGFLWFLSRTAFGQLTLALNGNEQRLKFLGFDTYKSKVLTFAISGMIAGLAGGLLAITNETANYTLFSIGTSTQVIFHAFIGGPAFFFGPAVAAAALTAIPFELSNFTYFWPLYQGLLFMFVMLAMPTGVAGLIKDQFSGGWDGQGVLKALWAVFVFAVAAILIVFVVEAAGALRHDGSLQTVGGVFPWFVAFLLAVTVGVLGIVWRSPGAFAKLSLWRTHAASVPRQRPIEGRLR